MSIQNKNIIKKESSKKVAEFLKNNELHKKDFAQMVGVTLSYVYNLIDETIPFSSRGTTLERIAVVMDILPEEFDEYLIQEEPTPFNKILNTIKEKMKKEKLSTVDFLKNFERKKRLYLVDMLRGVNPIPIDYTEIETFAKILKMNKEEAFELWKERMLEYLKTGKMDIEKNKNLIEEMFKTAKKYLLK